MIISYEVLMVDDYEGLTIGELGQQIDEVEEHIEKLQNEIDNMLFVLHEKILEKEKR